MPTDTCTGVCEQYTEPAYLVKSTFWPHGDKSFVTVSGPFTDRRLAEESCARMLFDPRVICCEILEE